MTKIIRLVDADASGIIAVGDILQDREGKYLIVENIKRERVMPQNRRIETTKDMRAEIDRLDDDWKHERWNNSLETLDVMIWELTEQRDRMREGLVELEKQRRKDHIPKPKKSLYEGRVPK